jgi:autoinducer 2-degrading protein
MFYEAYRSEHDAALHKQTLHYAAWRDTVTDMMAEPRRGKRMIGLLP